MREIFACTPETIVYSRNDQADTSAGGERVAQRLLDHGLPDLLPRLGDQVVAGQPEAECAGTW